MDCSVPPAGRSRCRPQNHDATLGTGDKSEILRRVPLVRLANTVAARKSYQVGDISTFGKIFTKVRGLSARPRNRAGGLRFIPVRPSVRTEMATTFTPKPWTKGRHRDVARVAGDVQNRGIAATRRMAPDSEGAHSDLPHVGEGHRFEGLRHGGDMATRLSAVHTSIFEALLRFLNDLIANAEF